jgi:hypothetical protein
MDERHAAEIAIVRAQRDALAVVVRGLWNCSRNGWDMDGNQIEASLLTAGLAETVTALEDDAAHGIEAGDRLIRLSAFGRASLTAARP